jgi:hypothetical protein
MLMLLTFKKTTLMQLSYNYYSLFAGDLKQKMIQWAGNTIGRRRLCTVELLIKVACFVKHLNNIFIIKKN